MPTENFNYTGSQQTWTVPPGVTSITATLIGGAGGSTVGNSNSSGGKGGYLQATINVTSGNTIYLYIGGKGTNSNITDQQDINHSGGFNGGGTGGKDIDLDNNNNQLQVRNGSGGGGATDIRINGTALTNRILIAGGGGGSGYSANGGNGGGTTGGNGSITLNTQYGYAGVGGSQSAGGDLSNNYSNILSNPYRGSYNGTLGNGGNATQSDALGSGGGGGGYYGGSAGSSSADNPNGHPAGGGGGSSYYDTNSIKSGTTPTHTQGYSSATGDGSIIIEYTAT